MAIDGTDARRCAAADGYDTDAGQRLPMGDTLLMGDGYRWLSTVLTRCLCATVLTPADGTCRWYLPTVLTLGDGYGTDCCRYGTVSTLANGYGSVDTDVPTATDNW